MNPEKKKSKKHVTRVGEYLVWAELARREVVAAPISSMLANFDVLAVDSLGRSLPLQVRAASIPQFPAQVDHWMVIDFEKQSGRQTIIGPTKLLWPSLIVTCVIVDVDGKHDRFFILTAEELQNVIIDGHRTFLSKHDGVRPRKPSSLDVRYDATMLAAFENRWDLIFQHLAAL